MSRYENYSEASKYYDKTRMPIGGEILIGVLAFSRQSHTEFRLLDAGCGTGAYSKSMLPYVDHIDAIDINPDMLAVGRKKFADSASDAVLRAVGKRLHVVLRLSDTATRLGGDEFAVILETDVTTGGAATVARKIAEALGEPIEHDGAHHRVGASIGIALFPEHADNGDDLVHCADVAMYQAKRQGVGFTTFEPDTCGSNKETN